MNDPPTYPADLVAERDALKAEVGRLREAIDRAVSDFVFAFLAPELQREVGDDVVLSTRLNGFGIAQAEMQIRPGATDRVVAAIRRLRDESPDYQRP